MAQTFGSMSGKAYNVHANLLALGFVAQPNLLALTCTPDVPLERLY